MPVIMTSRKPIYSKCGETGHHSPSSIEKKVSWLLTRDDTNVYLADTDSSAAPLMGLSYPTVQQPGAE